MWTQYSFGMCKRDGAALPVFMPRLQNYSAICPVYGKNLMRRLQGLPCLRSIKIRWFGSSATTVVKHLRLIFTLWHTSASSANPTIQGKHEKGQRRSRLGLLQGE